MSLAKNATLKPPSVRYFIRDDDVGPLTDELKVFVETFLDHGMAVSYQIIPAQFSVECAEYLLSVEQAHPNLFEFGQHGLHHEMQLGKRSLKREFGPERSLAKQQEVIDEGLQILRQRIGRQVQLFTPPQHKFDRNTIKAAANAGHKIFSAAHYPTLHHRFAYAMGRKLGLSSLRHHGISYHGRQRPEAAIHEVSISIAVDDGRSIRVRADRLPQTIARAGLQSPKVGLMFHHKVYAGHEGRAQLRAIAATLKSYSADSFFRIADLAWA